jgi:two-component system, OmpR family, copper resistance phosphate regulon response regulator CusR
MKEASRASHPAVAPDRQHHGHGRAPWKIDTAGLPPVQARVTGTMSRVLVASGEPGMVTLLVEALRAGGFDTAVAADGPTAIAMARSGTFDLLILDLELPGPAALGVPGVLRQVRRAKPGLPVLVFAGAEGLETVVAALEEGADDSLTTPFHAAELLARVRLRLRRNRQPASNLLGHGDLLLDVRTRQVWTPFGGVELTGREFAVLEALAAEPGQFVSRQQLLSRVWGYDFDPRSNLVEVYVRRLRRKLGPGWVTTVRGKGYRLERHAPPATSLWRG